MVLIQRKRLYFVLYRLVSLVYDGKEISFCFYGTGRKSRVLFKVVLCPRVGNRQREVPREKCHNPKGMKNIMFGLQFSIVCFVYMDFRTERVKSRFTSNFSSFLLCMMASKTKQAE